MDHPKALYIVLPTHNSEWEDHRIFLSREDAQEELDRLNKNGESSWRIEVFKIHHKKGYTPAYE